MLKALINKLSFFKFVLNHPLNRNRKIKAFNNYISWQIGSRLMRGDIFIPFVDHVDVPR